MQEAPITRVINMARYKHEGIKSPKKNSKVNEEDEE